MRQYLHSNQPLQPCEAHAHALEETQENILPPIGELTAERWQIIRVSDVETHLEAASPGTVAGMGRERETTQQRLENYDTRRNNLLVDSASAMNRLSKSAGEGNMMKSLTRASTYSWCALISGVKYTTLGANCSFRKLHHYGVTGRSRAPMKSYLRGRIQRVGANGERCLRWNSHITKLAKRRSSAAIAVKRIRRLTDESTARLFPPEHDGTFPKVTAVKLCHAICGAKRWACTAAVVLQVSATVTDKVGIKTKPKIESLNGSTLVATESGHSILTALRITTLRALSDRSSPDRFFVSPSPHPLFPRRLLTAVRLKTPAQREKSTIEQPLKKHWIATRDGRERGECRNAPRS
ncbi:hypothetical protein EVAR_92083_1 [Eumeta japonica]|uniref:Uncharacterized protein n=1 Tax=Eumeta variegata TaxID=151549 RepID=A0A4C1SYA9_EUMVA|nr:hypothetical protein EVAR_92083_1 [Eumeta japonica]